MKRIIFSLVLFCMLFSMPLDVYAKSPVFFEIIGFEDIACNDTKNDLIVKNNQTEVTISFIGDCTLGGYKGQGAGNQVKDYYNEFGPDYFFENVREIFEKDDITFINLEGPLTNYEQTAVKTYPIKGEPEYVDIMKNSSVEVCNLANNHIFDCGQAGFDECRKLLTDNGINYCGEGYSSTIEKNGIKVSFLGYRGFSDTDELRNTIKEDILTLRSNGSDVICVMFHYGIEREYYSNKAQEDLAHFTIDNGADIICSNHPHVIQGIESYKGKTICYSLGNFCFGANKNPKDKDTFIFQQTFRKDSIGKISYGEHNIIPCSISSVDFKNDYKPTPLGEDNYNRVLERLKTYSSKYEYSIFE